MASTTIFERKGLRFGMESSPASAEVKGSGQAEERETETKKKTERKKKKKRVERKRWASESTTREGEHAKSRNTDVWLEMSEKAAAAALYLPTLSPLEAPWNPAGKLTAGQRGRSPSSLHCRRERRQRKMFLHGYKQLFFVHEPTNKHK